MEEKIDNVTPTIPDYSRWHSYRLEERHAPWKVLLPVSSEAPVLAVGLPGGDLASLGRSWKIVHVYKCLEHDLDWATEHAQILGHNYHFERVAELSGAAFKYPAIAIRGEFVHECDPGLAFRLLEPGGSAAWVGGRRSVPSAAELGSKGFESTRTYAFLPPDKGKILVPLHDSRLTRAGLNLYMPGRWENRLALRAGRLAAHFGAQRLLGIRQLVIARKPGCLVNGEYLLDWLVAQIGQPIAETAICTGWTKLVLQLLDRRGDIVALAKVADIALATQGLVREAAALRRLETVPELRDSVPRILATGDWLGHTVQVQAVASPGPWKYTAKLTVAHLAFLAALSRIDRREMFFDEWPSWPLIWQWAHGGEFSSAKEALGVRQAVELSADVLGNRKITFHRIHGDFAPWNVFVGPNGAMVLDWEDSSPLGLPLYDMVCFATQEYIHRNSGAQSIDRLLNLSSLPLSIGPELRAVTGSAHLATDIARLAVLIIYMVSMHPQLRGEVWGR